MGINIKIETVGSLDAAAVCQMEKEGFKFRSQYSGSAKNMWYFTNRATRLTYSVSMVEYCKYLDTP
jgi:hypothetical protein